MSSKQTEPRSIASQLVLLFTLAAVLLLFCGLGVFYLIVIRHAFAEDRAVLADKLAALRIDLKERGPTEFANEITTRNVGERAAYWIRLLDSASHVVAETPDMNDIVPSNLFPPPTGSTSIDRAAREYRSGTKSFSLVAVS